MMKDDRPKTQNDGATVFDVREELAGQRRSKRRTLFSLIGIGSLAGIVLGLAIISWPLGTASAEARATHNFAVCGVIRQPCVVDGDTIWLEGVKIRIADIDTPEISKPQCDYEYDLGLKARGRLVDLLNDGEFAVQPIGSRDEDQYGRKLRVITRNGQSLGDQLVAEGLAHTWAGRKEPWCPGEIGR